MSGRVIDPRREQIATLVQSIGQSTEQLLREAGAGGFGFVVILWQKDHPVIKERVIVSCAPDTSIQQLDDALAVTRKVLEGAKEG